MPVLSANRGLDRVRESAHVLRGAAEDYDPLLDLIGEARFVLLGEASHGTHEFYRARAEITKRLIIEKRFNVIAWEADWPDALRVNRYIRGGPDVSALEALSGFRRFPAWMRRNADILDLVCAIAWWNAYGRLEYLLAGMAALPREEPLSERGDQPP